MNRIYKVIWSKVKHQYVVVSELAHRDGKRSGATSKTMRSRIAALAVCGAIAVFGGLPTQSVFAAIGGTATEGQYIAVAVDTNNNSYTTGSGWFQQTHYYKEGDTRKFATPDGTKYDYIYTRVNGENYWVREGYTIEIEKHKNFTGATDDAVIKAYKNSDDTDDSGLLQSYQTQTSQGKVTTATGYNIKDSSTGMYGGAVNSGGVETPTGYGYNIDLDNSGNYDTRVTTGTGGSQQQFNTYFKPVTLENGVYKYNGESVATNNLYVIGGTVGVFVNPDDNSVYTGTVYGDHNETLMTGMDGNEIYTYWSAKIDDPKATIGSMTVAQYDADRQELKNDIKGVHGDSIERIDTKSSAQNGGSIDFVRYGHWNGTEYVDEYTNEKGELVTGAKNGGSIKITSTGGTNGNDVAIQFQADGSTPFTVDAGSRVVGKVNGQEATEENQTLTGLEINGKNYLLGGGKTYTQGKGIAISSDSSNTISVDLADNGGLHFDGNKLANNLKVTVDPNATKDNLNGGNWTVTDTAQSGLKFTNTTLSSTVDKKPIADNAYGNTYTVSDTDGNKAVLEDVASASKLKEVAGEAEKHNTVTKADDETNITLQEGTNADGGIEYTVGLNKDLNVTSVTAGGTTIINADGLTAGNVKVNASAATVTGLSNTSWDAELAQQVETNANGEAGYAATQGQLKDVADAASSAATNAKKHNTVTIADDETNITLQEGTNADGGIEYTVGLNKDLNVTSVTAGGTTIINADGLTAGNVKVNASAATVTGLSNTSWDAELAAAVETNANGEAGYAATQGQLKDVADAASSAATNAKKHNTVTKADDETNITLQEGTNADGGIEYTVGLNKDLNVTSVTAGGTTIINADGLTAGNVKVNASAATVTGLSNTSWDAELAAAVETNANGEAGYAATQGQLKDVADAASSAATNAKKHNTVTKADDETNITLQEGTNADGGIEYTVGLNKDLNVTSVTAGGTIINADGLTAGNVKVNASAATVTGLSNTSWDAELAAAVETNANGEAGYAATQGQLKDVADAASSAATNAKKHNTVTKADDETNITLQEGTNADGGIEYTVGLNKDLNVTSVTAGGTIINADGLTAGNVKVNASAATVTGLSNTSWDAELAAAVETNANGEAGYAATQGQLKDVADAASSAATNAKKHNTVTKADDETNITLQEGTNADGGIEYTVGLNKDLNVTSVTAGGTIINADGLTAGNVKVNASAATVTGLSNTSWDAELAAAVETNANGEAGYAATQGQLKDVADAASSAATNAKKHNTVTKADDETNITLQEGTNADGGIEYTIGLSDVITLGEGSSLISLDGTTGSAIFGNVKISNDPIIGGYTISGLGNTTWDVNGNYSQSTLAATEAQLGSAFNYLNNRIDSMEITADDGNIHIEHPASENKGDGGSESSGTSEGSESSSQNTHTIGFENNVTIGGRDDNGNGAFDPEEEGSFAVTRGDGSQITINHDLDNDGVGDGVMNGLANTEWDWNKYGKPVKEGGYAGSTNAATESQLNGAIEGVMESTVQYDRVMDADGNVTIDKSHITLNEGGTTITNVAAGKNDMDAVNYSQLKNVQQQVTNNSLAINNIGNKVGELDSRIDKVGAGAAALAALHPLDFDPDDKWDFAAGYGNYRGESAVAIGAFYRPNEDTMFSVGGTVGNDDNMINAGVSFKIGQGNGVSTSRVAMAKEIKSMRDIVAKQDAQIQKLTAMVNALVGVQTETDSSMFPDVPENHWAYEAVAAMAKSGLVKGYPDGEFKGDRNMTRYEFAQIVYNAIQAGASVDARLIEEFKPELQFFHVATVAKDKDGNPTIERVRANK